MTTITFAEDIEIQKNKFQTLEEFIKFIVKKNLYPIEIKPLSNHEVTNDLIKEMEETKKLPSYRFVNLK